MEKELSHTSCREGILTIKKDHITILSDQAIEVGDVLFSKGFVGTDGKPRLFNVTEIEERRPSRGDWNDTPPCGGR